MHACIHACMHACIHTCMNTYIHTSMHACIHTYMHEYIHTYIHACMHTYIHACMHTYTYIYIYMCVLPILSLLFPMNSPWILYSHGWVGCSAAGLRKPCQRRIVPWRKRPWLPCQIFRCRSVWASRKKILTETRLGLDNKNGGFTKSVWKYIGIWYNHTFMGMSNTNWITSYVEPDMCKLIWN